MRNYVGVLIVTVLIALLGLAGSTSSAVLSGGVFDSWPLFAVCAALALVIQWAAFVPAYLFSTERYYDLVGSITYISLVVLACCLQPNLGERSILLALMVGLWAARLGSFLFQRVLKAGSDSRFDQIKVNFSAFLRTWSLQGLWVVFTGGAALAAIASTKQTGLDAWAIAGGLVWLVGIGFEIIADRQKSAFRADPANQGRFINTGLWARCRHPNYFGEIVLWLGVAMVAVPALGSWSVITLVSPLFVYLLLSRLSGIPLLERAAIKRWGEEPEFKEYMENTPRLFPF